MKDVEIIGMIKSYVKQTLVGMGALKGAPCQVQGVVDEGDGTQTLTLKWVDNNGDSHTTDITLPTAIFEITNPTNGQTIRYNGTSGKWENSNVSFSADLGDLDDVVITSAQDGQVLTYDAANNQWINSDGSTVADLGDLTDVTITSVQNGQLLSYNSTSGKWVNVSLDIDDLGNVSITNASDGQILTYNGISGKWENKTLDIDAADVDYDNTTSQMQATSVQGAIDENAGEIKQIKLDIYQLSASKIGYDGTTSGLSANKVQAAIDEVAADLDDKQDKLTADDGINIDAQNKIKVVKRLIVTDTMPTPSADYVGEGKQRLYVGNTGTYTKGTIYECQSDGATPPVYSWVGISSAEVDLSKYKKIFEGTTAEWNALSLADQTSYDLAMINDDGDNGDIATVVEAGNHNPVASDAVNTKIESLDYSDSAVAGSYVTEVSEADGIIAVTREAADASPTASSNKMVKSGGVFTSEQDIYEVMGQNGAKNYLQILASGTFVGNGITFVVNDDGTVTVSTDENGATGDTNFYLNPATQVWIDPDYPIGDYILSGCPSGGSAGTYRLALSRQGASSVFDTGTGTTFTHASGVKVLALIQIGNGTVLTTPITFKPMIRLASDTDSTYQPYAKTNKQLTDDSVDWYSNGIIGAKNLIPFPYPKESDTVLGIDFTANSNGEVIASGTSTGIAVYDVVNTELYGWNVPREGTYILSDGLSDADYEYAYTAVTFMYNDGTIEYNVGDTSIGRTVITIPSNLKNFYVGCCIRIDKTVSNIKFKPMLRMIEDSDETFRLYAKTNRELTSNVIAIDNARIMYGVENILPNTLESGTAATSVTYTRNSDGTVSVSGSAVGNAVLAIGKITGLTKVRLTGCPSGGGGSAYQIQPKDLTDNTYPFLGDYGEGRNYTLDPTHVYRIDIVIREGYSISGTKLFKPMVVDLSAYSGTTYDDYVPYAKSNRELTEELTVSKGAPTANTDYIASSDLHYEKYGKVVHVFGNFETNTAILSTDSLVTLFTNLPNSNGGMNGTSSQYTLCLLHDNTNDGLSYRCFVSNEGKLVSRYKAIPIGTYFADFTYICQ